MSTRQPKICLIGLVLAVLLMSGCKSNNSKYYNLIDAPIAYTDPRIDPFDHQDPTKQSTELEIFYATNRKRKGELDAPTYTNGMDQVLHLGYSTVRLGDEDTTWQELHAASLQVNRANEIESQFLQATEFGILNRNVSGKSLKKPLAEDHVIGEERFVALINQRLALSRMKNITIYMHGYKVKFEHGPKLAAQIHHFGNRQGVMIAFDWACRQKRLTYFSDERRGQRSVDDLGEFIDFLGQNTDAERINVIVWSAGGPIMSKALVYLCEKYPELDHDGLVTKLKLHNVIFAASDVDFRSFVKDLKQFYEVPKRLVITLCYDDEELRLSRRMHFRKSRLGSADAKELTPEEQESLLPYLGRTEVIDTTYEHGGLVKEDIPIGHHYFFRHPWVLTDVLGILYLDLPAVERGLLPVPNRAKGWYFPDDYPQRVANKLLSITSLQNTQ